MNLSRYMFPAGLAISALLQTASAGCYSSNFLYKDTSFKFGHLHSDPRDFYDHPTREVTQEVYNDIDNVCNMVAGANVGAGKSWDYCTEWPTLPDEVPYSNQIHWAIKNTGSETKILTYDLCNAAFRSQFESCRDFGGDGEQVGFWFRMDPNPYGC